MSPGCRSRTPESLEKLRAAIEQRTYGRLTGLSLGTCEGAVVVSGEADTYYTVQLAVSAIKSYRSEFTVPEPVKLDVTVRGRTLVLGSTPSQGNGEHLARKANSTASSTVSILGGKT